jgi:hypothetical protein
MHLNWRRAFCSTTLGLLLVVPLSGCAARPVPRVAGPYGSIDQSMSGVVTSTIGSVAGTGRSESIVIGDMALVAIQLDHTSPGGLRGQPLTGSLNARDRGETSPGGGPVYLHGPGGSVGTSTGTLGGGTSPGGQTPGGSPNSTQAVPNSSGVAETEFGASGNPAPSPSQSGATPFDVMQRVADHVRAKHPQIKTVRFVTQTEQAKRFDLIARTIAVNRNPNDYQAELNVLASHALPAGTTEFIPSHVGPGQPIRQRP